MLPVQRIQGVNNLDTMDPALDNPSPTTKTGIEIAGRGGKGGGGGGGGGILVSRDLLGYILFNDTANFNDPEVRVFDPLLGATKMFQWIYEYNTSFELTRIRWMVRDNATLKFDDYSPVIQDINPKNGEPANSAITNVTSTSVQLHLNKENVSTFQRLDMTIRLDWETDFQVGYCQSGIFTVINNAKDTERRQFDDRIDLIQGEDKNGADGASPKPPSTSTSTSYSTATATATATITASGSASSHAGDAAGAAGGLPGSESGGKGKGGLSTGVKAGIGAAVGVVGLLLLLGILFFFLRRKKRLSARGDPTTASSFLISDTQKMVIHPSSSSNQIAAPQISPIAHQDENESLRAPSRGQVTVGGDNGAGIGASSDGGNTSLSPSIEDLPTGVSRHLVEEGMTREQILLLEEEERQLDAAIERAARRH